MVSSCEVDLTYFITITKITHLFLLSQSETSRKNSNCNVNAQTKATMQGLVNLAISETNTAFQLSGIETELLLVHSYRHPTYSVKDFAGSLRELESGKVSGVHGMRKQYGADIVAMISERSQYCGIG
jgi:hypothetical protein